MSLLFCRRMNRPSGIALLTALTALVMGCVRARYDPALASKPYPMDLHRAESIDIQVFRDEDFLEIVNSTPVDYVGVSVWINQRYSKAVGAIGAGETVQLPLWTFRDVRGEVFEAGGLLRTERPTPVRLVEMQVADDAPLIGLITVGSPTREDD